MPPKSIARVGALLVLACFGATTAPTTPADTVIGPAYTPSPDVQVHDGVPKGTVHHFVMHSADSHAYPADPAGKPFDREAWVYVPAGYVAGTAAPLLVVQDGGNYRAVVTRTLDNLIAQHRVPPMAAVMVNPGPGRERSLEYDAVSAKYADFVDDEVLPRAAAEGNVTFTTDPTKRAAFGTSSGGAAAFTMAWFRTDRYRRVVTYSGSFTALHPTPDAPHGAWEYGEHLVPTTPMKPIRVTLQVGDHDVGADRPESSHLNWEQSDRRLAAALAAKGYAYRFAFAVGAKHVDRRMIDQQLPGDLTWAWQE